MRIEIEVDNSGLKDILRKLRAATDRTEILDEAGAVLLNRIRTRFFREQDPDEVSWIPSKPAIKRRSGGGSGTLFDTGTLFRSIQLAGTGPNERKISTDVFYGLFHQEGTKFMPQREFLGFNEGDAELVNQLIIKRIQEKLA
jgi:phage virion morphogenesis protein